jgi:hypothetical protein
VSAERYIDEGCSMGERSHSPGDLQESIARAAGRDPIFPAVCTPRFTPERSRRPNR